MKNVFRDAIDHGDIVILKRYVYLNFIALNKVPVCSNVY